MSDVVIVGTTAGTCDCCSATPPACGDCALDIAPLALGMAAFADYATALQYLDGTLAKADCYGWVIDAPSTVIFTANVSTDDQIILSAAFTRVIGPGVFNSCIQYSGIAVAAGCVLTVGWLFDTWSGANSKINIYTCAGAVLQTFTVTGATGSHIFSSLAAGQYIIACVAEGSNGTDFFSAVFTAQSSLAMVPVPIVAAYTDSPGLWFLEACPKMLSPDLTEGTGDLFPDKATAVAFLASAQISNCVGFAFNNSSAGDNYDNFLATDGGSTLQVSISVDNSATDREMKGCVNAVKGQTLSFAYVSSTTGGVGPQSNSFSVQIMDQFGNLIENPFVTFGASGSGTLTSAALPHTGKYEIRLNTSHLSGGLGAGTCTDDITISSSGTLTVNRATALYDRAIDCPGHVDC